MDNQEIEQLKAERDALFSACKVGLHAVMGLRSLTQAYRLGTRPPESALDIDYDDCFKILREACGIGKGGA